MRRSVEHCPDRILHPNGAVVCRLVTQLVGSQDLTFSQVAPAACEECCRCLRPPDAINPVIAAMVYSAATRIMEMGGLPDVSVARAKTLRERVIDYLSIDPDSTGLNSFPPQRAELQHPEMRTVPEFRWASAMLTAPRLVSTIQKSYDSLGQAGFDDLLIFAEPGSLLPANARSDRIVLRENRLGNIRNFYDALCTLWTRQPEADAYVVFQDDVIAAEGLRVWCETQLWPQDCGVVSLFTPRIHTTSEAGWSVLSPGFHRVCGAQGLVFRRDLLEQFLSDPRVLKEVERRQHCDDAVVAAWLGRNGLGLAYHSPSLLQHLAVPSSLFVGETDRRNFGIAVDSVADIATWTRPRETGRIGLVGWNTQTGLGTQNRDIVTHLPVDRWFVPGHPLLPTERPVPDQQVAMTYELSDAAAVRAWLSGLDWLLFAERPYMDSLPRAAAHAGVGVACIANWEWLQPNLQWLPFVDLMICPTHHCFQLMRDWKERYGYSWRAIHVPWPVDHHRFVFRQREICREFLFVNGFGGGETRRTDGTPAKYQRKGMELILQAAELCSDLKFIIRSLVPVPERIPRNVRIAPATRDNGHLYEEGDVCVQPSHFEGIGLQLLECQAAGMPLITTGAPPMTEAMPWKTIPVERSEVVEVGGGFISSQRMTPESLVNTLKPLVGTDIREASLAARRFVDSERRWDDAASQILSELLRR